jgi:hypothetical protein
MIAVIHDVVTLVVITVVWLIPAGLVARLAQRRGHSFAVFGIAALVIPWPIILLVVLALPRGRTNSEWRDGTDDSTTSV